MGNKIALIFRTIFDEIFIFFNQQRGENLKISLCRQAEIGQHFMNFALCMIIDSKWEIMINDIELLEF